MKDDLTPKIYIQPNDNGELPDIVVRSGEAEEIKDTTRVIEEEVSIASISDFINKKKFENDPEKNEGLLMYSTNLSEPFVKFMQNPSNNEGTVLTAKLEINPDLTAFKINSGTPFSTKELKKLLREKAHCFAVPEKAGELIKTMNNCTAKVTTEINKEDDRNGNTNNSLKQALEISQGELPKVIDLKLPIYLRTEKEEINLEVEIDVVNNTPVYSFYSNDLQTKKEKVVNEAIKECIEAHKEKFVVLEQ